MTTPDTTQPSVARTDDAAEIPRGFWRKAWLVLKTIQARLRFIAILVAMGAVIGYWDTLKAYYEKWTRMPTQTQASSATVEYFCPMHPQIVRDNPSDKCPICFMPLSKRSKGSGKPEPLPAGTVSRVQLSPFRVVLAGAQTSEVGYQPLVKEISAVGYVEFDERRQAQIAARVRGRIDKLYINVTGQMVRAGDPMASLYSPDLVVTVQNLLDAQRTNNRDLLRIARERLRLWDIRENQVDEILKTGEANTHLTIRAPINGHVIRKYQVEGKYVDEGTPPYDMADLSTVWIQAQVYEDELALLKEGLPVSATTPAFGAREFDGKVAFVHPHLDQATRTLTVRFDMDNPAHELRPGMFANVKLRVPIARLDQFRQAEKADPRVEAGEVLAVPESAVIDTGSQKIVYRESSPGVFDGVEVKLGPRSDRFYSVLGGLAAGDQVVTAGSFLIDAETRLNPAAGSIYFGGSGGGKTSPPSVTTARPSMAAEQNAEVKVVRAKLSPEDRRLVDSQDVCAILPDDKLGSMGPPFKLVLNGRAIFLCCSGCEQEARAHPEETLANLQKRKPPNGASQ